MNNLLNTNTLTRSNINSFAYNGILKDDEISRDFGLSYAQEHPGFWRTKSGLADFYNAAAAFVFEHTSQTPEKLKGSKPLIFKEEYVNVYDSSTD